MFNWGVCDSCKKSKTFNNKAVGCDLAECRFEPIPTNSVNSTTSIYTFAESTDKERKMDKEKEIKEMTKVLVRKVNASEVVEGIYEGTARNLVNAGYGNVKQAVKEFAEKIEKLLCEHENRYSHLCKSKKECHDETCRYQAILRLHKEITELYGAEE